MNQVPFLLLGHLEETRLFLHQFFPGNIERTFQSYHFFEYSFRSTFSVFSFWNSNDENFGFFIIVPQVSKGSTRFSPHFFSSVLIEFGLLSVLCSLILSFAISV